MNIMLCVFLLVTIQSAMARRCLHECLAPEPASCNPLPTIPNGKAVLNVAGVARPGDTATVQCGTGYITTGTVTLTCNSNKTWTPEVQDPCNPVCSSIACNGCCNATSGRDSMGSCVEACTGGFAGYTGTDFIAHDKTEVLCGNSGEYSAALCECLDNCLARFECRSVTYYHSEQRCYISTCDPKKNVYDSGDVPEFNVGVEDVTLFIRSCANP